MNHYAHGPDASESTATRDRPRGSGGGSRAQASSGPTAGRELSDWLLTYRGFVPEQESLREALCTVGNGLLATRGAAEWVRADGPHYPGTYLAGGYDRLETEVAGRVVENEDLVNWPNWLPLTFRAEGGEWLRLDAVDLHDYVQELDMRRGILSRTLRFTDDEGREFELHARRLVHMDIAHMAAIEWTLIARNWSGAIEICSGLDGDVANGNVARYRQLNSRHVRVLETGQHGETGVFLTCESETSRVRMCQAARTEVFLDGEPAVIDRHTEPNALRIDQRIRCTLHRNRPLRIEKVVAIFTSRDHAICEPRIDACERIDRAPHFRRILETHVEAWDRVWHRTDIAIGNKLGEAQSLLRLHIFHLLQTTSMNTIGRDVGVPARGWHGEAYRGHIFWDELFIFPFLNLALPELTRTLLLYRYHRLEHARYNARDASFRGAMYPWQSGSNGREESQVLHLNPRSGRWIPDHTFRQRHVNGAIAYNIWQYYQATGDLDFLGFYGAEILIEIARFWSSIATFDATRDRYVIRGVVGPDEFHTAYPGRDEPGLDNNAYTNILAVWTLRTARTALTLLDDDRQQELRNKLDLEDEELLRWRDVARRMFVPFLKDEAGHSILSQFEGYDALTEFDWSGYRAKYGDIQRLDRILEAEGDSVNRYKASKQADVLMLFYLFCTEELQELFATMGYEFRAHSIPRTIEYYEKRTSHGSTLSRVVAAWVLARMDREHGWFLFSEALRSDIDDLQGGTTSEGIHLGAMASTVDLVQRGYAGLEVREDVLTFNPQLPDAMDRLATRLRYRRHWLSVEVTHDNFTVCCERGDTPTVAISFRGTTYHLHHGECRRFQLARATPKARQS